MVQKDLNSFIWEVNESIFDTEKNSQKTGFLDSFLLALIFYIIGSVKLNIQDFQICTE